MGVKNILNWVNGPYVLWEPSIIADIDFLMREKADEIQAFMLVNSASNTLESPCRCCAFKQDGNFTDYFPLLFQE